MMEWIKEYIISIIAAGTISAICITLVPTNTSAGMIIKMLAGILLTITLVSPIVRIRIDDLGSTLEEFSVEANSLVQTGSESSEESLSMVIKDNLEAYILDKANALGLSLDITVMMNKKDTVLPERVRISGAVSPYHKGILSEFISEELGISEDQQQWN